MSVRSTKGMDLKTAAKELGITRPKLLKHLKQRGYFHQAKPIPHHAYVKQGLFSVETKGFSNDHGYNKQYAKALITGAGLALLHDELSEAKAA